MRAGQNGYSTTAAFDFFPIGQAIKKAREAQGITREQLAESLDYAPRHIQAIENEGQHPSLDLLIQLVRMFGISMDQFIFPEASDAGSRLRSEVQMQLTHLDERELTVVEGTITGLLRARKVPGP